MNVTRPPHSKRCFKASAERVNLKEIRDFCTGALESSGVSPSIFRQVILAVDEVASNIVDHAYPATSATQSASSGELDIEIDVDGKRLVVEIRDRGVPFNPLDSELLDLSDSFTERRKRGYGLSIIHSVIEEIRYKRSEKGENVLTMVKSIG